MTREDAFKKLSSGDKNFYCDDLFGLDLKYLDFSGTDLRGANLRDTNLRGANLRSADLYGVDLLGANLRGADLRGANLDFASWPLWCGGLHVKIDKRLACQLAYHFCNQDCDDPEYIEARNAILKFANQFHRVSGCGILEPR